MIGLIVNAFFWIINQVANAILSPILLLLNVFDANSVSPVVSSIGNVFTIVGNYFLVVVDLLCIPRSLIVLLLTITITIATWVVAARTYFFVIMIYRHFKP